MSDADERPDWLPAVPAAQQSISPWKRAQWLALRLPSLLLIALAIGLVLLAGANLAFAQTSADRKAAPANAIMLTLLAAAILGVAALIRARPNWINYLRLSPISTTGAGTMTTQQFFGALLRAIGIWQLVSVIAEAPQSLALIFSQVPAALNSAILLLYLASPVLRAILGLALLLAADSLARIVYPDRGDDVELHL